MDRPEMLVLQVDKLRLETDKDAVVVASLYE